MEFKLVFQFVVFLLLFFVLGVYVVFGYIFFGGNYVVDVGFVNLFIFFVSQFNCDIRLIKYRGIEFQYGSQFIYINFGFGFVIVLISQINGLKKYIKVICVMLILIYYIVVCVGDSSMFLVIYIIVQFFIGEL